MHGTACICWANRTYFPLQDFDERYSREAEVISGLGHVVALPNPLKESVKLV
jgi:hypothetical protein